MSILRESTRQLLLMRIPEVRPCPYQNRRFLLQDEAESFLPVARHHDLRGYRNGALAGEIRQLPYQVGV
jgi:hypothetical protein